MVSDKIRDNKSKFLMIITRMLSIFAELVLGVKNHQRKVSNSKLYQELIRIVDGNSELSKTFGVWGDSLKYIYWINIC